MMERLTGARAAERLTRTYEGKGEGHHVGHFLNMMGRWTVFEVDGAFLHYVETAETEAHAASQVDRLFELEDERRREEKK